jgi:hypothetical protein
LHLGAGGAITSEFVQSALPYKRFEIGDVVANLLGAGLALYAAETLEKRRREKAELSRLYLPADEEALLEEDAADGLAAGGVNSGGGISSGGYPPFTLEDSDSEDGTEGDARRLPSGKR